MPYGISANDTATGFNFPVVVTLNPDFPYYGSKYSSVTIQQHGFIVFGTTGVKIYSDLSSCANNIVAIGIFVAKISNSVGNIFYR
ncbi:cell wall protein DAN4 [Biomphalaria pfeifferi]|uniref:Cell wall protein DAN4 n=1 Tax=Biomphalaria pfeifferi TaxID=112525 RepID=A0AAD8BY63_BIOPF|nr:cell wall protein DAN4 [Biomphalaria pfeifferi]